MSKAPAFQFYANDFVDATRFWDANAVGLYMRCLCIQWTQGSIPADLKVLARGLMCDLSELQSVWPIIGAKFAAGEDGLLRNKRLELVRKRQTLVSSKRSDAAHARWDAHPNADAKAYTKRKQRKVKEKEKVEGEEEREVEQPPEERNARKGPDPDVQGVIDHLTERLRAEGIAQSIDGPADNNRWAARSLILKLRKDYPDHEPLVSAKALIDAAIADPFHRKNTTTVRYLLNNCGKIIAATKERKRDPKTQTHADRQQELATALERRRVEREQAAGSSKAAGPTVPQG